MRICVLGSRLMTASRLLFWFARQLLFNWLRQILAHQHSPHSPQSGSEIQVLAQSRLLQQSNACGQGMSPHRHVEWSGSGLLLVCCQRGTSVDHAATEPAAVGVLRIRVPELVEGQRRMQLQQFAGIVLRPSLMHSGNVYRRHAQRLEAVAQDHVVGGTGTGTTAALHDEPHQRQAEHDAGSSSVVVEAVGSV